MEYVNLLENVTRSSLPVQYQNMWTSALDHGNKYTKNWPVMNPFHAVLLCVVYLIIVFGGMAIMKTRKKFELYWFSLLHNGFLVMLSSYMCYETIHQALVNNYTLFGNGVDESPRGLPMARVLWLFYISKPIEFIDTFIMMLKKNNHQISFLHVYHHVATFLIWWGVTYYAPGGDTYFSAAQNTFVHVLMYSYYFLATLKVSAPWKYYLTQIQMLQFALNFVQGFYVTYYDTPYPKLWAEILMAYMVTLLILFGNFYVKGTRRAREEAKKKKLM